MLFTAALLLKTTAVFAVAAVLWIALTKASASLKHVIWALASDHVVGFTKLAKK